MSGSQCCSNPPAVNPTSGAGHVEKLGGLDSYVNGSVDSKLAVILVADVFGYEAPKLRKLADKVAAAGFYVLVPDYFHGDPLVLENTQRPWQDWIKDHSTVKAFEETKPLIEALKGKGISAIGAAGFCWGAKVVVDLAKTQLIQAAVLLHPSFVDEDDIKGVEVPMAILGAEFDERWPPELLRKFEVILNAKSGVDSYVKIFFKAAHGWTVRYNSDNEEEVKSAEEAHQNMLDWFAKYVK
ncbi:hypothetical protein HS088_TW13G01507 [Tripterygium wilfordii]|uniref:Dienelactone hydrolase domain-containing protein n=1 Tax=Tripterygium wilfordii TaxID=458696 RepID=A0A7J7CXJ7_TRIWF|nr:endo-1,3;1,4-beta-D-glucanase-like [Tripterygium wilfordii]KAF5738606.1 hypothetical protein HS088_TW13G01507 [Tripterygium wilfordii]